MGMDEMNQVIRVVGSIEVAVDGRHQLASDALVTEELAAGLERELVGHEQVAPNWHEGHVVAELLLKLDHRADRLVLEQRAHNDPCRRHVPADSSADLQAYEAGTAENQVVVVHGDPL